MKAGSIKEFDVAWTDFALAFQELKDSIRMFLKEHVRVAYYVCTQNPNEHVFDNDDWRIIQGHNWRTRGKLLCPKCAGILEERSAKIFKR
jgi:hypothetical protein